MKDATFSQACRFLEIVKEKNPSREQIQRVFDSGLLGDLLEANFDEITPGRRDEICHLLGLKPVVTETRDFAIWKTVTLGLKKSPKDYKKAMEKDGYHIIDYAGQILNKTEVSQTEVELDLVAVTVGELGFKDGARRDVLYTRAIELGLQLCPAEVGPALRLAYKDQPKGEWLRIGMEPIAGSDDNPYVFGVGNGFGALCLGSYYGLAAYRWVFVRPSAQVALGSEALGS